MNVNDVECRLVASGRASLRGCKGGDGSSMLLPWVTMGTAWVTYDILLVRLLVGVGSFSRTSGGTDSRTLPAGCASCGRIVHIRKNSKEFKRHVDYTTGGGGRGALDFCRSDVYHTIRTEK